MVTLRGGSPAGLSNHPPALPLALPLARSFAGSSLRSSLLAHLSSTPAPIRSSSAAMLLPPRAAAGPASLFAQAGQTWARREGAPPAPCSPQSGGGPGAAPRAGPAHRAPGAGWAPPAGGPSEERLHGTAAPLGEQG